MSTFFSSQTTPQELELAQRQSAQHWGYSSPAKKPVDPGWASAGQASEIGQRKLRQWIAFFAARGEDAPILSEEHPEYSVCFADDIAAKERADREYQSQIEKRERIAELQRELQKAEQGLDKLQPEMLAKFKVPTDKKRKQK